MNIKLKSLTGKIINLHVKQTDTIHRVKELVQEMEGPSLQVQRIMFKGKMLNDEATISQSKIESGSILNMVLALRGGGKKSNEHVSNIHLDIPPIIIPDDTTVPNDTTNLIDPKCDDTLYEIRFRNTPNNSYDFVNNTSHIPLKNPKTKKLCCLIL